MKITCPKCHSTYKVDLPDPSQAGIDVQCGNCLYIFLFSPDIEKPGPEVIQRGTSAGTGNSDIKNRSSEPILPPQKDEDQEVSGSNKPSLDSEDQATPSPESSPETDRETLEELELEPLVDDPEAIEIIVENDAPDDSLEEVALDDIWDQAMQEGTRATGKSKEKSPSTSSSKPGEEPNDEETLDATPTPQDKKSKPLPSLEDRQREIDQILASHRDRQGASGEKPPAEGSQPLSTQKDRPQEKTQEEIDLEEQVVINEEEAMPNWEEAFTDQAKVEAGWKKAQEQDRILEEQQLVEALGKKGEPTPEEKAAPPEDKQSLVDEIFAEAKGSHEPPKETIQTPQPKSGVDQKQDEVDQIFAEAQARKAKAQEESDLEEQISAEENTMPSWEEAFADQSEVESGWRKAQVEDRIHEEQQLSDALGEESASSKLSAEEIPETQENKQDLVDQLFSEARSQQEFAKEPEAITQDEPLEISDDMVPSSETQETHVDQHTIPGGIDLMTDLDDLNMKQLVTQAFREESEAQEKTESSIPEIPAMEEGGEEPPLTMESTAETPQEAEPPPLEPIPPLEMESPPETTPEAEEVEPEPVEAIAEAEDFEVPSTREMESLLAEADAVKQEIPEVPEPLEMESEPEPTLETQETTASTSYDNEAELWADLLPETHEEGQPVEEEAPVAFTGKEEEGPFGGDDFWDQVLEKDTPESQTAEIGPEQPPVAAEPVAQDAAESETLTDEELWKQAFPGETEPEQAASQDSGEEAEDSQSKVAPLVIGASAKPNVESEDLPEYDEAAYADYDDDDDEFEFQPRKRKLGPFTLPHGRRGDLVIGGAMVVFLLLAGSVYFTLQTFAPGELTDIETAKTEVPEGLSPREVPLDELAQELTSPKPPKPEKIPAADTPGDKGEAILSDPAKILEESPEEKGILKDLAESKILKDTGKSQTAKIDQSALEALSGHSVTMSTIMPVAYNPTDIRVLSFSVEIQLSDARSAKRVRESLPVYEDIMNQTVEDFLRRKFYNDILYVKEKLQKRLQTAMNKSLKTGRVRKTKFTEFAIQ